MVYNLLSRLARAVLSSDYTNTPPFFFLINKYVSSVVHHGHPAGERGFYTNF